MFHKDDDELMRLQRELLAAEEEEEAEECEEYENYDPQEEPEDGDMEGYDENLTDGDLMEFDDLEDSEIPEDTEESFDEEDIEDFEQYTDEGAVPQEPAYDRRSLHRYRKGSPKKFDDDDFFDRESQDGDVLYKKDYKKAKKKKRRLNLFLVILAICELIAIAAIAIWWATWML